MTPKKQDYDSREVDYILREAISNLKGKIDFLSFGGLECLNQEESFDFLEKLRNTTDELYNLLSSSIIEKANKISELNKIIQKDMELAKKIQENILPAETEIKKIQGIDCYTKYIPMSSVGGDIFDIIEIKPGTERIFLADATGHGVQAGLVTMLIKSEYDMIKKVSDNPSTLLKFLNNEFVKNYKLLSVFFTCIVMDIDIQNKKIIYSSAGHIDQYLIDNDNKINIVGHSGKMIGLNKNMIFKNIEMDITKNNKILLFSDGIFEQFNIKREMYGEETFKKLIIKHNKKTLPEIIDKSISDLFEFIGDGTINDDITILGITIK